MTEFNSLLQACGGDFKPGKKPILGGPLDPIGPVNDPVGDPPGDPVIGIFIPNDPVIGEPLYECVENEVMCPAPFGNIVEKVIKVCQPCIDTAGNPVISIITSPAGFEQCKYRTPDCDDVPADPCVDITFGCPSPPKYKCQQKIIPCPPNTTSNNPAGGDVQQILRNCVQCTGAAQNDPDCIYDTPDCAAFGQPDCQNEDYYLCSPEPDPPDPIYGPAQTGGPATGFKCVTTKIYCPPDTPQGGKLIGTVSRECETCSPINSGPNPPVRTTGKPEALIPDTEKTETGCSYGTATICAQSCPPTAALTGYSNGRYLFLEGYCGETLEPASQYIAPVRPDFIEPPGSIPGQGLLGGSTMPSPSQSVSLPTSDLLRIQEKNSRVVDITTKLIKEDDDLLRNRQVPQKIYDKELNLFSLPPDPIKLTGNSNYLDTLNDTIDVSIERALRIANTSGTWSEDIFFNITSEKIAVSLNPSLLTAFKLLRFPGGEVVGEERFLQMVKKHIVTGTMSRLDPNFYIDAAKSQLQQNFTILEKPPTSDYTSRGSINYIIDNGEPLNTNKDNEFQRTQINRGRFLNEDLNVNIPVETLLSGTKPLAIPNEGILLEALTPKVSTTPVSVGDSNLLNIGDGGGYYLAVSSTEGEYPLVTDNFVDKSYYLPDFHKSKVLSINGMTLESTITASSLSDQNEFVTGDTGANVFEPMYFGMNLGSVSSTYNENPLIETYTATYSRIVDSDQIARHANNNALTLSEYRIGYDDPLYRYILDTSSFELTQEDLTAYGFKDVASSLSFNFPKNIPFAIVIVPVVGSKFNPLNVQSTLLNYIGGSFRRSLKYKPSIGTKIDGSDPGKLSTYNLYNKDGSQKIGLMESPSLQSFGYEFKPSSYKDSFYDGTTYTSSIDPVSSFGAAYLLREVIDFIAETTPNKVVTWFDLYRRMPFNRFSELFYTATPELFKDIKNGFRGGIKPDFVSQTGGSQDSLLLPDDSKVIITVQDRQDIKKKEDSVFDGESGVPDSDIRG